MTPLADLRILSLEQFGAGPWATLQLADLGAEVIKVEDPTVRGDVGRVVPPYQQDDGSLFFETFNRNKRSLALDLRQPEGRDVFEDLVRVSDAVFSNLRGDGPAKLGLRYDDLKHVNERIVCVSLSGFGMTGPRAGEGAYDATIQGLAGWMSVTGGPENQAAKDWKGTRVWCAESGMRRGCQSREADHVAMYVSRLSAVSKSDRSASPPRPSRRARQTPAARASAAT